MADVARSIEVALSAMKRTYVWLSITYHSLHPSLHNSIPIHFSFRNATNAEFAAPVPGPIFAALPLPIREHLPNSEDAEEDQITPFERMIRDLKVCSAQLYDLAEAEGTVHEGDGRGTKELLDRNQALQVRAGQQLFTLETSIEAHVMASKWLAGRGIFPWCAHLRNARSGDSAEAWLVRVSEWAGQMGRNDYGSERDSEDTEPGYVSGSEHSHANCSLSK